MRRSCSKRRLKVAAHRRRRLRCVAFCAHVRYRDPSTVEANRADCNGRSPHMRTRVPPAINLPLCAVRGQILGVPDSRALFARAVGAWASGGRETRRVRSTLPAYLPRARAAGRPKNFYQKKMNTGVSAGTAITTTLTVVGPKPDRTKRRIPARTRRPGRYTILYARGGGPGRGGVQDALRACLRACLRATDARNRTANARAASCSAWGPCFACMGQQVIMVDGRWSL